MKLLALLPMAALAADVVVASVVPAHHYNIARKRLSLRKRCQTRPATPTSSKHSTTTSTSSAATPTSPTSPASNPPAQHQGTINVGSECGDIGATSDPSTTGGPNGSIFWLNCGIDNEGWRPPYFTVTDVIAKDLNDVLSQPGNPYGACNPYLDAFYKSASQHNIPPILLAAIAMQESSCNKETIGANGEQGLMQITPDKCSGGHASDGCRDPYFNIDAGAKYLRSTIDSFGGNLPQALGQYNGWTKGMSHADATRARDQGNCFAQNNLDYLHQTFNGWLQGVDPYQRKMGFYFNLNC